MKTYWLTGMMGLAIVLNGCGTSQNSIKPGGSAQDILNSPIPSFADLGNVTQTETGIKLVLSGDPLFKIGRSRLNKAGILKIDHLAAVLARFPGYLVTVEEYTDNNGTSPKNLKLSQRRANSIKLELVKNGVPAVNVTAVGEGDLDPFAVNEQPKELVKNQLLVVDITTS